MQIPQFVFESGICYPSMMFPAGCAAARKLLPGTETTAPMGDESDAAGGAAAASANCPGFVSAEEVKAGICVKRHLCICITQPRRVAAVALARRVAEEMGAPELVGYQVGWPAVLLIVTGKGVRNPSSRARCLALWVEG